MMEALIKKIKENVVTNVMVAVILGVLAISFNTAKRFVQQPARNEAKVDSVLVLYNSLLNKYEDLVKENEALRKEDGELKENMGRVLDVLIK